MFPEDEEYLSPGGTSDSLHSADNPVTLRDVMSWSYQIAKGMEYLASIDVSLYYALQIYVLTNKYFV